MDRLRECLEAITGSKLLVVQERPILGLIELLSNNDISTMLKASCNVVEIIKLGDFHHSKRQQILFPQQLDWRPPVDVDTVVFLIDGWSLQSSQAVIDVVKSVVKSEPWLSIAIVTFPKAYVWCRDLLERSLCNHQATAESCSLHVEPWREDLCITLMDSNLPALFMQNDVLQRHFICEAFLETLPKPLPLRLYWIGDKAGMLAQQIIPRIGQQDDITDDCLHEVYIFDRFIDTVTPLLHQQSYEGLLDEIYGIEQCNRGLLNDLISADSIITHPSSKRQCLVGDPVFEALQCRSIDSLGEELEKLATVHDPLLITLHADLLDRLLHLWENPDYQRLLYHERLILLDAGGLEALLAYFEELLVRRVPMEVVLRLFSLWCQVAGGDGAAFDGLFERICQTYGMIHGMLAMHKMYQCRLLKRRQSGKSVKQSNAYASVRMAFGGLTPPPGIEIYPHTWPICAHLLDSLIGLGMEASQMRIQAAIHRLADILGVDGGYHQFPLTANDSELLIRRKLQTIKHRKITLVFLGGCTLSEIACMQAVVREQNAKSGSLSLKIITSGPTNGHKMISQFIQSN